LTTEEKPTPGNEGASIEDRLTAYLSAQEPAAQKTKPEAKAKAEEPADSAEKESVKPDGDGAEEDAGPQITTSDLAKLLGVDETALDLDEDGSVKFKTKVDGKEGAAKLADFIKSYQLQEHVDRKARDAAEQEKALKTRQQEAEQAFAQRLQYAENLTNVASQQLMAEFQSVDWKSLEQQDPGTAALYRQKFQERQSQLMGVYQNIQREKAEGEQKSQREKHEALAREAERLPQLIPEWKDATVATKERAEIRDWALKNGYEPSEVDSISKANQVAALRKAMLADRLQSSKPAIENKVRTAPKLVKPGQAKPQDSNVTRLQDLKAQVTKTGGKNGTLEAYLLASGKA
jgi:hypothetical protein